MTISDIENLKAEAIMAGINPRTITFGPVKAREYTEMVAELFRTVPTYPCAGWCKETICGMDVWRGFQPGIAIGE